MTDISIPALGQFENSAKDKKSRLVARFRFNRPNAKFDAKLDFWYRVVTIGVAIIPSWLCLIALTAMNDYEVNERNLVLSALVGFPFLAFGEYVRKNVFDKISKVEANEVEMQLTSEGLSLTEGDVNLLMKAKSASGPHDGGVYVKYLKRLFDIALVVLALPFVLCVIGVVSALVLLEGGPVFYTQERLGKDGKAFRVFKFRTMVKDAESRLADYLASNPDAAREWETIRMLRRDPRVTPLGRFLRRSSLDELPQLWNVLLGDMSLIGPRPILPIQRDIYSSSFYFDVRPGPTGLWQVADRNNASSLERLEFDKIYSKNISLKLDLEILFRTFKIVIRGTGL